MRAILLLALAPCLLRAQDSTPRFETADALEAVLFPADDEGSTDSLKPFFGLDSAGGMVGLAAKLGPPYAMEVAKLLPDPEFKEGYKRLADYLDRYGPCQKHQNAAAEGWWSSYPDPPDDRYCGEATKLVLAATLWNQVHYCKQLVTGEAKPKIAVETQPPYRLDQPPVKTHWVRAEALYALADAALRFELQSVLEGRAQGVMRNGCFEAATPLRQRPPNRELIALALGKLIVRRYEAAHLRHMERYQPR